ncbi:MAG: hypothetical protein ACYC1C_11235 [Chloroflexota bacterium]
MIGWPRRTLSFSGFTVGEYIHSGRILVELLALILVWWFFFKPQVDSGLVDSDFFSVAGLFFPALAAVTTAMTMSLGNRPQGYVVLGRALGRTGYLIGLYLAAIFITAFTYLLLLAYVLVASQSAAPATTIVPTRWLLGTLALFLNVGIAAAFVTLLTPLVISRLPRLILLALLGVALSGLGQDNNLLGLNVALGTDAIGRLLGSIVTAWAVILLPVGQGYGLAVVGTYGDFAVATVLSQLAVMLMLLALGLVVFCRRELIFRS